MGAAAILTLGSTVVAGHAHNGSPAGVLGLAGRALATVWVAPLVAAEVWRARRIGRPHFTPDRWTTVFRLGMYSACSQALGHALGATSMVDIGRWWLVLARGAWIALAAGELNSAVSVKYDA